MNAFAVVIAVWIPAFAGMTFWMWGLSQNVRDAWFG